MVKQIIKEAMDQNPLGLKEAVAEELRTRVALALEAKMGEMSGLEEAEQIDERFEDVVDKYTLWDVSIGNNYKKGGTSDFGYRPYPVLASSKEEAKKVVLDNADAILKDLKTVKKTVSSRHGIKIDAKHIGLIEPGEKRKRTSVTPEGSTFFSPKGKMTVKLKDGVIMKESVDLEEAKMTDAEVLSAAKALAANGKDAKTKAFGKGLVDFYKKEGSFTPAQVGGLQNIMKNASFQMAKESMDLSEVDMGQARSVQDRRDSAKSSSGNKYHVVNKNGNVVSSHDNQGDAMRAAMKNDDYRVKRITKESVELDEAVVGAGPAFFDDGSHTTISPEDAAAINRMFASKSSEEQATARKKMKASKSYYSSILAKARKG